MSGFYVKRPKRGEDDEDLLRFQDDFMREGKPAAQVVRTQCPDDKSTLATSASISTDSSEVATDRDSTTQVEIDTDSGEIRNVMADVIVEKSNVEAFLRSFTSDSSPDTPGGFPVVPTLTPELLANTASVSKAGVDKKKRKKSLFLQQLEAKRGLKTNATTSTVKEHNPNVDSSVTAGHGDGMCSLKQEISKENEDKLSKMTNEEILAEQQELYSMLDPAILQMLKSRKTGGASSLPADGTPQGVPSQLPRSDMSAVNVKFPSTESPAAPLGELELPLKVDKAWLNMDKLESDKLKWLQPLQDGKQDISKCLSARFNFDGKLVDPNTELPTTQGLHHHGEEPSQAGYTLEELYVLVRSLNASQKILALSTIANILRKARSGHYQNLLNTSLMTPLLEADIILLLRYALDEKSELVIAAAINAWHALLVVPSDQDYLTSLRCTLHGHLVPQMSVTDTDPPQTEEDVAARQDEQYTETLKRDVISGLMMMDFLPRLRYVLEVVRPQQVVVTHILEIIARLAMTSKTICYQIVRTPRLLEVLFNEFLPESLEGAACNGMLTPVTMASCLRLMHTLIGSGRNLASILSSKHNLCDRIVGYVLAYYQGLCPELIDAHVLVECLYSLRSLVLYGISVVTYHVLYSILVQNLHKESHQHTRAAILSLLTAYLSAAGAGAVSSQSSAGSGKTVRFSELSLDNKTEVYKENLEWTHVAGLLDTVYSLMTNELQLLLQNLATQPQSVPIDSLIAAIDFTSEYLRLARTQTLQVDCMNSPMQIMSQFTEFIRKLLISPAFNTLLSAVRKNSIMLQARGFLTSESPHSLPSLCSVRKVASDEPAPENENISLKPAVLLHSLLSLTTNLLKVQPEAVQQVMTAIAQHQEVQTYIKRVCTQANSSNSTNYFSFVETSLLINIAQLTAHIPASVSNGLHQMAFVLVPMATTQQLYQLEQLMSRTVFRADLFRNLIADVELQTDQCLKDCTSTLPSICNTYISMTLPMGETFRLSRAQQLRHVYDVTSYYSGRLDGPLLPADWPYLPILHLFQKSQNLKENSDMPPDVAHIVRSSLQFIYLLEAVMPSLVSCISVTARIIRTMCCFLLDNDLFLEPDMQRLLASLLKVHATRFAHIDFSKPVPGLTSFFDLYGSLVEQFEAASFGNDVFTQYMLLPMAQSQAEGYRKVVWCEHPSMLRSIGMKPADLMCSVDSLLYPEETNPSIIMVMMRYLLDGTLTEKRNPLMYLTALHHVNRFMYRSLPSGETTQCELQAKLLNAVKRCTVEPLCLHLTHYKEYSSVSGLGPSGVVCYDRLPASRCQMLSK